MSDYSDFETQEERDEEKKEVRHMLGVLADIVQTEPELMNLARQISPRAHVFCERCAIKRLFMQQVQALAIVADLADQTMASAHVLQLAARVPGRLLLELLAVGQTPALLAREVCDWARDMQCVDVGPPAWYDPMQSMLTPDDLCHE